METLAWEVDPEAQMPRNVWGIYVKVRAGWRCEDCKKGKGLHSHHVNRDPEDNRPANGRCLCDDCHRKEHTRIKAAQYSGAAARYADPVWRENWANAMRAGRQRARAAREAEEAAHVGYRLVCECDVPMSDEDERCIKCGRVLPS